MVLCAIWYHSYNLKNVKNTHGGVLLLVKLQVAPHLRTVYLNLQHHGNSVGDEILEIANIKEGVDKIENSERLLRLGYQ